MVARIFIAERQYEKEGYGAILSTDPIVYSVFGLTLFSAHIDIIRNFLILSGIQRRIALSNNYLETSGYVPPTVYRGFCTSVAIIVKPTITMLLMLCIIIG